MSCNDNDAENLDVELTRLLTGSFCTLVSLAFHSMPFDYPKLTDVHLIGYLCLPMGI